MAWASWVVVSVIGGVLGALVAWRVRALLTVPAPAFVGDVLRYIATIVSATIAAGAQWLLLRRYRLDVYWWVPATVIAELLTAIVVIPSVLRHAVDPLASVQPSDPVIAGGAALAAAGLVIGAAQAIVLRASVGDKAWFWVPVTAIGGGLAGAPRSADWPVHVRLHQPACGGGCLHDFGLPGAGRRASGPIGHHITSDR